MTRIAVVSPSTDAYSETFISSHIELLPAKVHVLSGGHLPTYGDGHSLVKDYSLPKRIRFRLGQQRRGLAWDGQAKHIATIEEFLRRHQIQAVLAEYGPTGVAMMEVCERAGIPLVVHFHGYDAFSQEVVAEYRKSYHQLFSRCAALVASSYFMKDRLISLGAPHRLVQRDPYGVDITKFRTTSPEKNVAALLAVGRFVNKKAPYLTLLAFYQAQQVVDELRLIMVGDGPIWETCVRLSGVLGIGDKVDFLGVQSPDEIVELMKRARGFVQHSVTSLNGDSEITRCCIS
ncbi:MAG: glycosyltransferase [Chloroflexota bacterium]